MAIMRLALGRLAAMCMGDLLGTISAIYHAGRRQTNGCCRVIVLSGTVPEYPMNSSDRRHLQIGRRKMQNGERRQFTRRSASV
jgi:hypothetical protein